MPKRTDIKKVLIIGSGPIVIGQACEFDYSGTQACKALRKLGYQIVLVNSNPATIMTDPGMADVTYIEPLTRRGDHGNHQGRASGRPAAEPRRPDGPEPGVGARRRGRAGQVRRPGHRRQGRRHQAGRGPPGIQGHHAAAGHRHAPQRDRLQRGRGGEDRGEARLPGHHPSGLHDGRHRRRRRLQRRGTADHRQPGSVRQPGPPDPGRGVRPGLGGAGAGGRPRRQGPEDHRLLHRERRSDGRPHGRFLLHRPHADHRHRRLQEQLQKYSYDIVDAIEVIGGTNIQFAHDPATGRIVVIEINPRTSRSSALASKATGFPDRVRLVPAGRRPDPGRNPLLARTARSRSTPPRATTSSSSSPAGPSRSSRASRTGSAPRCGPSAR